VTKQEVKLPSCLNSPYHGVTTRVSYRYKSSRRASFNTRAVRINHNYLNSIWKYAQNSEAAAVPTTRITTNKYLLLLLYFTPLSRQIQIQNKRNERKEKPRKKCVVLCIAFFISFLSWRCCCLFVIIICYLLLLLLSSHCSFGSSDFSSPTLAAQLKTQRNLYLMVSTFQIDENKEKLSDQAWKCSINP